MSSALPSGTVTFLFTDIEGSTSLWEEHPHQMGSALARHDEILAAAIEAHGGVTFATGGDGVAAAFARAGAALVAAAEAQAMLQAEPWPEGLLLRSRMGLHTGEAEERAGDYFGPAVNRAARVMALAGGGQIFVSLAAEEVVRSVLPPGFELVDLGERRLRSIVRPERVFQLVAPEMLVGQTLVYAARLLLGLEPESAAILYGAFHRTSAAGSPSFDRASKELGHRLAESLGEERLQLLVAKGEGMPIQQAVTLAESALTRLLE